MEISIIGLGYVGCISAAAFAKMGHKVVAVDIIKEKVDAINNGRAVIYEKGLNNLIKEQIDNGNLHATMDYTAILNTDISFICVGTPSTKDGDIDIKQLKNVYKKINEVFKGKSNKHIVVIRSTIFPGSLKILGELSRGLSVATNPEFLREGSAIKDFFNPPYIIIGAEKKEIGDKVMSCYNKIKAKKYIVKPGIAQMIKYANNSWHGAKVVFANEIGTLCKRFDVDAQKLMKLFCEDNILNLSPYYLKPGFSYGGSCLGKDLSVLVSRAKKEGIKTPLLNSIKLSNDEHTQRAIDLIKSKKKKKIGILGLSFKAGTGDIRNSPILNVIDNLVNDGYDVKIFDDKNKRDSIKAVLSQDIIIIANNDKRYEKLVRGKEFINLQDGY